MDGCLLPYLPHQEGSLKLLTRINPPVICLSCCSPMRRISSALGHIDGTFSAVEFSVFPLELIGFERCIDTVGP